LYYESKKKTLIIVKSMI